MLRAILLVAAAISLSLRPVPAAARGDLVHEKDSCVLAVGPELIYFTGYQPASSHGRFCEDAPALGATIFVFDYAEPELREMKAGFRISRQAEETDEAGAQEEATTAFLPPRVYPHGTFSFEHVFTQPGDYVGVLTMEGAQGLRWTSRFPFSVGKRRFELAPYYLIAAAAALAVFLLVVNGGGRSAGDRSGLARR